MPVADHLEHEQRHGQGRSRRHLAGRGLDEVAAGQDREPGRAAHVVVGVQLAGLEDDLEVRVGAVIAAARLLDRHDLVEDDAVVAGEEGATVDHHVDLVGAGGDRLTGVGDLDVQAGAAARERGRDRGHGHAGHAVAVSRAERLDRHRHQIAVHAHRRDMRGGRVGRVRVHGLGDQGAHLAGGVRALEGGEVHEADGRVERPGLGRGLDAAGAERGRALLETHGIHTGQAVEVQAEALLGEIGPHQADRALCGRQCSGRCCHRSSLASGGCVTAGELAPIGRAARPGARRADRGSCATAPRAARPSEALSTAPLLSMPDLDPDARRGAAQCRRAARRGVNSSMPRSVVSTMSSSGCWSATMRPNVCGSRAGAARSGCTRRPPQGR